MHAAGGSDADDTFVAEYTLLQLHYSLERVLFGHLVRYGAIGSRVLFSLNVAFRLIMSRLCSNVMPTLTEVCRLGFPINDNMKN